MVACVSGSWRAGTVASIPVLARMFGARLLKWYFSLSMVGF